MLSFFIPGVIVVYLYVKIFRKLRSHRLYIFGQMGLLKRQQNNYCESQIDKPQCLPKVTIEEVMITEKEKKLNKLNNFKNSNIFN